MDVRVRPMPLNGSVEILSSKSQAHRILIAAALSGETVLVRMRGCSKDVQATISCLESLGAKIVREEDEVWRVIPLWTQQGEQEKDKQRETVVSCKESGSTLRFLIPVAAALGRDVIFTGEGRLPSRPVGQLLEQLIDHGCSYDRKDGLPLKGSGRLRGGRFYLPGNVSSQFITGLLFALPMVEEDSEIILTSPLESAAYIQMTIDVLKRFGVTVTATETGYQIPGRQRFFLEKNKGEKAGIPAEIRVEGDWSAAAFWLAAGALGDGAPVSCTGLDPDSLQGDRAVAALLSAFGAEVGQERETGTIWVSAPEHRGLTGIRIDAAQIPDLVPILAVVAAAARGKTEILRAGRLRIKESDRLAAVADCLGRLGAAVEEEPEGLVIQKDPQAENSEAPVCVSGYGDHRIVMSMAVAAIGFRREVIIQGAEAVEKSYPDFFTQFRKAGGSVDVL